MFLPTSHCMTNEEIIEPTEDTQKNDQEIKSDVNETAAVSELDTLKAQLAESNDKFLRLYAEFDNYKRRTMKERSELLQTAGKEIILSLLPVIDDFERAMKADALDVDAYKAGIDLIHQKFSGILESKGLKAFESIGTPFNVDLHEAITNIPAPTEDMKGKVVDETERGYQLNGQVIRFAKVIVGE